MHHALAAVAGFELPLTQFAWMGMCAILVAAGFIILNYPEGVPFPNEKQWGQGVCEKKIPDTDSEILFKGSETPPLPIGYIR